MVMESKQLRLDDIQDLSQQEHDFESIPELPKEIQELSEKECIEIIREHGTEEMKKGLESILEGNKWKAKKTNMWKRLGKGKLPVRTLYRKKGDDIFES